MAKNKDGTAYITEAQAQAKADYVARKEAQRQDIIRRREERAKLTDEEQIARLDRAFGVGVGAKRERERLAKRIAEQK